jgi:hypothetical protein
MAQRKILARMEGEGACVTTRHTLLPRTCSLSQLSVSTCSMLVIVRLDRRVSIGPLIANFCQVPLGPLPAKR